MSEKLELKIQDFKLDTSNPRIEEKQTQIEALQAILDDQGSKIVELAEDISVYGMNPIDRFLVLFDSEDDKYIALEGNRRIAALQILNNPTLLDEVVIPEKYQKRLKLAAVNFDAEDVEPLDAVDVESREKAKRWIRLRHTGENKGRGIVQWTGVQSARYAESRIVPIIDFINAHSEDENSPIIAPNFPITTLERILDNPQVRKTLGIEIDDGRFQTTAAPEEIIKPLKKIAEDLNSKSIKVDDIKTAEKQLEYVNGLGKANLPDKTKSIQAEQFEVLAKQVTKSNSIPKPPVPPSKPQKPRAKLVPSSFSITISNHKIASLLHDLRRLSVSSYTVSVSIGLRVFIEGSVDIYMDTANLDKYDSKGKGLKLAAKIDSVCTHLKSSNLGSKQAANAAKAKLTSTDSVVSTTRLHEFVHNTHVYPSNNELLTAWDSIESWLVYVWQFIEENS